MWIRKEVKLCFFANNMTTCVETPKKPAITSYQTSKENLASSQDTYKIYMYFHTKNNWKTKSTITCSYEIFRNKDLYTEKKIKE